VIPASRDREKFHMLNLITPEGNKIDVQTDGILLPDFI